MDEEYRIVCGGTAEIITEIVNRHIKEGYKPVGGIFFDAINICFYQAMYKSLSQSEEK